MIALLANLFCLIAIHSALAQPPDTLWTRLYPEMPVPAAVKPTQDGGFILAGYRYPEAYIADACLIKTDSLGNVQWTHSYGQAGHFEQFTDVVETPDGEYIAAGLAEDWTEFLPADVYVVRTDVSGDTVWTRTYDLDHEDVAMGLSGTDNGDFLLVGVTGHVSETDLTGDVLLLKLDANGDTLWHRRCGSSLRDHATAFVPDIAGGGYYVGGWIDSLGSGGHRKGFLLKTTLQGDSLWMRIYVNDRHTWLFGMAQAQDSGIVLCGSSAPPVGDADVAVLKTDATGTLLWRWDFGGDAADGAEAATVASNGDPIVFAETESFGAGGMDHYLVRLTPDGDTVWTQTYGGTHYDFGIDGVLLPSGELALLGVSHDNAQLLRLTSVETSAAPPRIRPLPQAFTLYQNHPNPFNSATQVLFDLPENARVELTIFNTLGQKVATLLDETRPAGAYRVQWNGSGVASGLYICQIKAGSFTDTKKMVLLR